MSQIKVLNSQAIITLLKANFKSYHHVLFVTFILLLRLTNHLFITFIKI